MAYKTRLNIKHNYIKSTLKSSHEDIIIEHKLWEKKGELQIRSGIHVGFTNFTYTKNQQNNYTLQG
jgi:outer membrane biogenesis lipoprotein LolB